MGWGKNILLIMILAGSIVGFTTFNTGRHQFYYFPDLNVYYNLQENSFIYTIDGGQSWLFMKATTGSSFSSFGRKIILTSRVSDIWKNNEAHRNKYYGFFINLVAFMQSQNKKTLVQAKTKPLAALAKTKTEPNGDASHTNKQQPLDSAEIQIKKEIEQAIKNEDLHREQPGEKKDMIAKTDSLQI